MLISRPRAELAIRHGVDGAGICAALARPVGVDTADQASTAGVVFRPGGLAAFTDVPAAVLTDPVTCCRP